MLRVGPIVRVVKVEEQAEGAIGKPAILMTITTRCPRSTFLILLYASRPGLETKSYFKERSRCVSGIAFCEGRFSGLQGWCSSWGAQAVILLVAYSKLSVPFWVKRAPFLAVLCHFQNPAGPEQLQQVARSEEHTSEL